MYKQRLSKVIFCIALTISVFLCNFSISFADDTVASSDLVDSSIILVEGCEENYEFSLLADLAADDYTGSTLFQVLSQETSVNFMYMGFNQNRVDGSGSVLTANYLGSSVLPVYLTVGFQVERGHTYSGAVQFNGHTVLNDVFGSFSQIIGGTQYTYYIDINSFVFNGYTAESPDDVDVSLYPVLVYPSDGEADYFVNINFNNYQSTYDGYVYINLMLEFELVTLTKGAPDTSWVVGPFGSVSTHSTDWVGTLKDYATDAIIDSDGSLIKNQTIQQQQIANQQSQQSAQQHEDLKNGFQDDTYNSNVSNAGNTVDSYISVESDLMNSQNQIMSNYTDTAFNTGTLAPFTNAIAMCSTWYTWIWNSFGELNVAFVVVLAVGVACLIVGIKKRG